ncbi:ankyrin repeat domain-containing protein [Candidatus Amoebophilus asiaticus]|uniref:ankyrin repeat domain-containing protein n=1 Tax=Candidatus Amoebophilus asiaticus TaxID=281120 RepID=UPI0001713995|nr:ankyrin repeat domain-containing protein [Candidatus Amoebophilus asiaticus]
MHKSYRVGSQLIAYVLLISSCLQSCSGLHNPIVPIKQEGLELMQANIPQIDVHTLTGQALTAEGGDTVTFYEYKGVSKASVETIDEKDKIYNDIPVDIEKGVDLISLIHLPQAVQKKRVHIQKEEGRLSSIIISQPLLMGGMEGNQDKGNPLHGAENSKIVKIGRNRESENEDSEEEQESKSDNPSTQKSTADKQILMQYAVKGDPEAQFLLGEIAYKAWKKQNTKELFDEARRWLKESAQQGYEKAINLLAKLGRRLRERLRERIDSGIVKRTNRPTTERYFNLSSETHDQRNRDYIGAQTFNQQKNLGTATLNDILQEALEEIGEQAMDEQQARDQMEEQAMLEAMQKQINEEEQLKADFRSTLLLLKEWVRGGFDGNIDESLSPDQLENHLSPVIKRLQELKIFQLSEELEEEDRERKEQFINIFRNAINEGKALIPKSNQEGSSVQQVNVATRLLDSIEQLLSPIGLEVSVPCLPNEIYNKIVSFMSLKKATNELKLVNRTFHVYTKDELQRRLYDAVESAIKTNNDDFHRILKLIKHGANPYAKAPNGKISFELVSQKKYRILYNFLREKGDKLRENQNKFCFSYPAYWANVIQNRGFILSNLLPDFDGLPPEFSMSTFSKYLNKTVVQAYYRKECENDACKLLHWAANQGSVDYFVLAIEELCGTKPQAINSIEEENWFRQAGTYINLQDSSDITPLHIAAKQGGTELFDILVKLGANLTAEDTKGRTALYWASKRGNVSIVSILKERGVNLSNIFCSKYKQTPLHIAVRKGHFKLVESLIQIIENEEEINVRDKDSNTPLHLATNTGNMALVKLLIKHNAKLHARDKDGNTPLHMACMDNRMGIMNFLLESSAKPNMPNDYNHLYM